MDIFEKIEASLEKGAPLEREEILRLYGSKDLNRIGRLAHRVRTEKSGKNVYYALNRHLNYTNICTNSCLFCAFSKREGNRESYLLDPDEIIEELKRTPQIDEVHLVGACHPHLGLKYYMEAISLIKREFPHVGVKGLTAVEVAHISKVDKLSIEEVLIALKEAGLDALAGGGAEILKDQIRERICPQKISSELWLQIHKKAHTLGIVSNATMLFGHIEGLEDRVEHLLRLRELQEETGGFMAFVPLPFLPKNTALGHLGGPDGVDILKTVAISRLVLHNFPHIKAYWVMMGIKLASLALLYGADDLEGTVLGEKIGKEAGGTESLFMDQRTLLDLITETGFIPLRRDVLYRMGGKDEMG